MTPSFDLHDAQKIALATITKSGTTEITLEREGFSLSVTIVSGPGKITTKVPIARRLFRANKFGKYADLSRAILMIVIRYANLQFQPSPVEEAGFKKLKRFLWP